MVQWSRYLVGADMLPWAPCRLYMTCLEIRSSLVCACALLVASIFRVLPMENYVLYGRISQSSISTNFKGRRKATIDYFSIHRYDTSLLEQVSVNVNLLHKLDHTNIIKFFEWYQSPQHLWVVTELASGGTLADMMDIDGPVPLENLPPLIADVLSGLKYVHSINIILCDINPSKIILDAQGILKLYDISLAVTKDSKCGWSREVMMRNYEELFKELSTGGPSSDLISSKGRRLHLSQLPSPFYLSPESINSCSFTFLSDLWSVGCIMYELWTGFCPFVADSLQELIDTIAEYTPYYIDEQENQNSKIVSVLKGLLAKDMQKRMNWKELDNINLF